LSLAAKYWTSQNTTHRVITTNGIPDHSYYQIFPSGHSANPNSICEQFRQMTLPVNPTRGSTYTILPLGPVGILVSGGFLYNHLDGTYNTTDDLALYRITSLDSCNGHPDQGCRYHYHLNPGSCISGWNNCSVVGYLADGFPVYGFCTINGTEMRSCYDQINGTNGLSTFDYIFNTTRSAEGGCHLDEANGYCFTDGIRGIQDGSCSYGYVLTSNYPFVIPSYHGSVYYGMNTLASFPDAPSTTGSATPTPPPPLPPTFTPGGAPMTASSSTLTSTYAAATLLVLIISMLAPLI
jgi:hypothetical protein